MANKKYVLRVAKNTLLVTLMIRKYTTATSAKECGSSFRKNL